MPFNSIAEISLQCCTYTFSLTKQYRILQNNSDFFLRHRVQAVSEAHPTSNTSVGDEISTSNRSIIWNIVSPIANTYWTWWWPLGRPKHVVLLTTDNKLVVFLTTLHCISYTSTYIPYLHKECVQVNFHPPVRLHGAVPNEAKGQLHMHNNTNFER